MNKYLLTLIFYTVAFIVIYVLNKLSPNAHDGGLGFGSMAIVLLALILVVLVGLNIYRGIKVDKEYFIIAGIHLIILIGGVYKLFLYSYYVKLVGNAESNT